MAQVDFRIVQLVASRIAHDLVGPVGAVNAGIELMEEAMGGDTGAIMLMQSSGAELSKRLAFFRVALGQGSSGGDMPLAEAKKLSQGYLDGGKVILHWPDQAAIQSPVSNAAIKVLLLLVLMGSESLPRGGTLTVKLADLPDGFGMALTAQGQGGRIREDIDYALGANIETGALTPRNVHAYCAKILAAEAGGSIEMTDIGDGQVQLAAIMPSNSSD